MGAYIGNPTCCCGGIPGCELCGPAFAIDLDVTFAGFVDGTCLICDQYDELVRLTHDGITCQWTYDYPARRCDFFGYPGSVFPKAVAELSDPGGVITFTLEVFNMTAYLCDLLFPAKTFGTSYDCRDFDFTLTNPAYVFGCSDTANCDISGVTAHVVAVAV